MKKSFALRIDTELMAAVEKWASDEFRSTNGQIEWILSEALKKAGRHPKRSVTPSQPENEEDHLTQQS